MSKEAMKLALEAAYLAGFNASGEGYNGEFPFGGKNQNPEHDSMWCKDRDNDLEEALAKQEQGEPVYHLRSYGDVTKDEFERYIATGDINATPQQRTWVGFTELEMAEFVKTMERGNFLVAIYDIEKKLKDKNK